MSVRERGFRFPVRLILVVGVVLGVLVVLAAPAWLPFFGSALAVDDLLQPADVALVLEGTGKYATDDAEGWRQRGLVHDVVIVEAPVKTHALVAYWSDFVRWGLAAPSRTPPDHLRVVRAASSQGVQQASAALDALQADSARSVLVPGGGGIGSRLVKQQLVSVLGPAGIQVLMIHFPGPAQDPGTWYLHAPDRRAVLDTWLQLLIPYLSGYEPDAGS